MKEKIMLGVMLFITIMVSITLITELSKKEKVQNPLEEEVENFIDMEKLDIKDLSFMVYDEETDKYVSQESIPKGRYVLNEEHTYCENNGVALDYNSDSGEVRLSLVGADVCYMYFDPVPETCTAQDIGKTIGGYICSAPNENCFECTDGKEKVQLRDGSWTCK